MPNSLDEEETQCLLSSEDTLAITYGEEVENTLAQKDHSKGLEPTRISPTVAPQQSSNKLFTNDSDFAKGSTFCGIKTPSNPVGLSTVSTNFTANSTASSCSNEYVPTDCVMPTLGRYLMDSKLVIVYL